MSIKKIILDGWIYCLSNKAIPNLYKIGMTKKTPEKRAAELFKTGIPEPFVIEFAKNVNDPMKKEKIIHKLLSNERHHPKREFFKCDLNKIKNIFSLCDGIDWESADIKERRINDIEVNELEDEKKIEKKKRKEAREYCFHNGQRIRHQLPSQNNHSWIGKWDSSNKCIEYNNFENNKYSSLTSFAQSHSNCFKNIKNASINGWKACECHENINGKSYWTKCNIYKKNKIINN